jgi:hypothetical protein
LHNRNFSLCGYRGNFLGLWRRGQNRRRLLETVAPSRSVNVAKGQPRASARESLQSTLRCSLTAASRAPYVACMQPSSERSYKRKCQTGADPGGRLVKHTASSPSTVRRAKAAKATLRPLLFASGAPSGPVEISPRLKSAERAAVEFWIQRMPEAFAKQLLSSRHGPLKVVVADRLMSIGGSVFINQKPPGKRDSSAEKKEPQRFSQPYAVSYIPERYIVLERALFRRRIEHGRILYHELCHFLWPRLGNQRRRRFQELIRRELRERVRGELGYSSGTRKASLFVASRDGISRRAFARQQRGYFCECFCDTGAYVLLGSERRANHSEFTLSRAARERRARAWKAVALSNTR